MAIKLDMTKAYNHVEQEYLWQNGIEVGFAPRWVDLKNALHWLLISIC